MSLIGLGVAILFIGIIIDRKNKNINEFNNFKNKHEIQIKILKIQNMFNNLMRKSPLIKEIVKIKIMENLNIITEEEYNKIDIDLLEIKQNKMMRIIIDEKFKTFILINENVLLNDTYNYLKNIDYYEGDLSCELIIIEPDEPVKSKEPVKPKIYKNPYFKY